ncbi:PH domain-containing protein [Saccharopolyspora dendranthemae]|uniref:PH (Pleckstrin Homology) domain-containing protein n=1 Tax=Saccharopolyspora dendranthemae TaxID=1181886 RepID=A0A561V9Q8_9PSEU|nr:PH domain-containing protein [Saccharopolyspora dendranthemae]TWG08294.1 PH (Pleckstrin Homology) domain-containing protein [Saccharopolyspora dendranthemae]
MSTGTVDVRPRKVRRVAIPLAILLVGVFALVGTLLRSTPTGVVFNVSDQIAMGFLGLLLASGVMLLTRPRLRADAEGLEVRNIIGTQRIPWQLVQGVTFPDGAPWARVELPEDEYVPIMAVQATDGNHAVTAMRELRELRRSIDA